MYIYLSVYTRPRASQDTSKTHIYTDGVAIYRKRKDKQMYLFFFSHRNDKGSVYLIYPQGASQQNENLSIISWNTLIIQVLTVSNNKKKRKLNIVHTVFEFYQIKQFYYLNLSPCIYIYIDTNSIFGFLDFFLCDENLHLPCATWHHHHRNLLCYYFVSFLSCFILDRCVQQLVRTSLFFFLF